MNKYFKIYTMLLRVNFATLSAYKANFITSIISSVGWGVFSILFIILLTSKTSSIYGWSREEIILLTGFYNIIIGTFHVLFSRNFERFSDIIFFGQLDSLLLKPADSQFLLSFWFFNYIGLLRVIIGIIFSFYMLFQMHISFTIITIAIYVIFSAVGIILLYSLWYILLTLTIWFTRLSNVVDLLSQINGITRHPPEIFTRFKGFILIFLLPLTLIVALPTKVFLNKLSFAEGAELILFALMLFFISRKFWKIALRFYTSASS